MPKWLKTATIQMRLKERSNTVIAVQLGKSLGDGTQSCVFVRAFPDADNTDENQFIKIYRSGRSNEVELQALLELQGIKGVPVLIAYSDDPSAILASPVGVSSLNRCSLCPVQLFRFACSAFETLHAVNTKNIYHRDISPNNLMVNIDGTALIVDWGTAICGHVEVMYEGGTAFAANEVINTILACGSTHPYIVYTPAMDLESMVKTVVIAMVEPDWRWKIYRCFPADASREYRAESYESLLNVWNDLESHSNTIREAMKAARECNYDKLMELFTF